MREEGEDLEHHRQRKIPRKADTDRAHTRPPHSSCASFASARSHGKRSGKYSGAAAASEIALFVFMVAAYDRSGNIINTPDLGASGVLARHLACDALRVRQPGNAPLAAGERRNARAAGRIASRVARSIGARPCSTRS